MRAAVAQHDFVDHSGKETLETLKAREATLVSELEGRVERWLQPVHWAAFVLDPNVVFRMKETQAGRRANTAWGLPATWNEGKRHVLAIVDNFCATEDHKNEGKGEFEHFARQRPFPGRALA